MIFTALLSAGVSLIFAIILAIISGVSKAEENYTLSRVAVVFAFIFLITTFGFIIAAIWLGVAR
jgi:hypothetical protein